MEGSLQRAVIFAGGRGTRMGKCETIKPLVNVKGLPIIDRVIDSIRFAGIDRISVVISEYTKELRMHRRNGIELDYLLINRNDLAHAILEVILLLHEPFIGISADKVIHSDSIVQLLDTTSKSKSAFCVLLSSKALPQRFLIYQTHGCLLRSIQRSNEPQSTDIVGVSINCTSSHGKEIIKWAKDRNADLALSHSLPDWESLMVNAINSGLDVDIVWTDNPIVNINRQEDIKLAESFIRE